ncbi:MAG: DUF1269 domain-containing protein [Caldilineales bacterium]|nr:DUF1269 domain-containing protein [Caldilineales bacterium]
MAKHIIVVVAFDSIERATEAYKKLEKAEKDKLVEIDDAVVVTRDESGNVHHKDMGRHAARTGAKWGGALGLFVGFGLGGPVGGAAIGAAGGAVAGALGDAFSKLLDVGFSKDQIELVSEHLKESNSALLVDFVSGDVNLLRKAADQSGGDVLEFTVADAIGQNEEDIRSAGLERDR